MLAFAVEPAPELALCPAAVHVAGPAQFAAGELDNAAHEVVDDAGGVERELDQRQVAHPVGHVASVTRTSASRRSPGHPSAVRRWASQTGMIDSSITALATTFTIGGCSPRLRLFRIHCGSVSQPGTGRERGDHDLVEAQAEGQQPARQQRRAHQRERHVAERLERVGAEIGRRFLEVRRQSPQPGERRCCRATTMQNVAWAMISVRNAERSMPTCRNGGVEGDAGDDARQRDRQHDHQAQRVAPEEAVALHGERRQRAEHERHERRSDRRPARCSTARRGRRGCPPAPPPPLERDSLGRRTTATSPC